MEQAKKTLTFDDLMRSVPPKASSVFEIDMSRFFPDSAQEEPVVFTFRKLGVSQIFGLEDVVSVIRTQKPEWSEKLCLEIAGITVCHLRPEVKDGNRDMIPHFYCALFQNASDADLLLFLQEFGAKAGSDFLNRIEPAVQEAKKN